MIHDERCWEPERIDSCRPVKWRRSTTGSVGVAGWQQEESKREPKIETKKQQRCGRRGVALRVVSKRFEVFRHERSGGGGTEGDIDTLGALFWEGCLRESHATIVQAVEADGLAHTGVLSVSVSTSGFGIATIIFSLRLCCCWRFESR